VKVLGDACFLLRPDLDIYLTATPLYVVALSLQQMSVLTCLVATAYRQLTRYTMSMSAMQTCTHFLPGIQNSVRQVVASNGNRTVGRQPLEIARLLHHCKTTLSGLDGSLIYPSRQEL
jgi:hypothetical protein